uniref:Uncharacterized protein n=1 Tax=viral metagenome TaxID=1070528 RepID=A0A6M3JQU7_9ZZZZ
MEDQEKYSDEMFATGSIIFNGKLCDIEKLQISLANAVTDHNGQVVFQTTSNERLYVLHRTILEKAVSGDITKLKQLLGDKN